LQDHNPVQNAIRFQAKRDSSASRHPSAGGTPVSNTDTLR
jgi:hypothetical protein